MPRLRGHFEAFTDRCILGWAFDGDAPDDCVPVELLIDDAVVATIQADIFRTDLLKAGLGNGKHSFRALVPDIFFDGAPHTILLRIAGTENNLTFTPKVLVFGAPAPAGIADPSRRAPTRPLLSLVMPTFNRGAVMEQTVRALARCKGWDSVELIIVNDGSRDDTAERLAALAREFANITTVAIGNSGPAHARNLGASQAQAPLLLLIGDDTAPVNDGFLANHIAAHESFPEQGAAVLGKIVWPAAEDFQVNFVMQHIQGEGQEQFGFKYMEPYQWYDWRFFYSSNISLKRELVADWRADGFDEDFLLAAYEDAELGFRLSQRQLARNQAFRLLYVPGAALTHRHPYTVASFIRRQESCGQMARVLFDKHPQLAADIGIADINARLAEEGGNAGLPIEHYFSVFEGIKSWALILEHHGALGSQNWHGGLLKAVFRLAYAEGYLRTMQRADANVAAGARCILDRLHSDLDQIMVREALGQVVRPRVA